MRRKTRKGNLRRLARARLGAGDKAKTRQIIGLQQLMLTPCLAQAFFGSGAGEMTLQPPCRIPLGLPVAQDQHFRAAGGEDRSRGHRQRTAAAITPQWALIVKDAPARPPRRLWDSLNAQ